MARKFPKTKLLFAGIIFFAGMTAFCVECPLSWGGREAHPAIVNPVLVQENVIWLPWGTTPLTENC